MTGPISKPCPYCRGTGIVPRDRDTLRMRKVEFDAIRKDALPTPPPPPPLAPIVVPLLTQPAVPLIEEDDATPTTRRMYRPISKRILLLWLLCGIALLVLAAAVGLKCG